MCIRDRDFRIHRDFPSHFQISAGVHKNVADPLVMFDDRNFRAIRNGTNQAFAAAWHTEVNVLCERKQNGNRLAVGRRHDLNRVFRKMCERFFACINHRLGDDLIRVQSFLAAAQNRRIAGFKTQARRVRRHVWPGFVDNADDAQGYADAGNVETCLLYTSRCV